MKNNLIFVEHILEAICAIEEYLETVGDFEGLVKNRMAKRVEWVRSCFLPF